MQSGILPRGLYNNKPQIVCAVLFLQPECVLSVSCASRVFCLCVILLTTSGAQRGARVKPKGCVTPGDFKSIAGELLGKSWGIPHHHYGHNTWS